MRVRIHPLATGVRVILEHAAGEHELANNLARIYGRADAAHEEWRVLDLIVRAPRNQL